MNRKWFLSVIDYYKENARDLPWRSTTDPYHIWISEIMLQQTRADTVRKYYDRFFTVFPDIYALSDAESTELMKCWEGLGYYSRARNLQKAASVIVSDYNGHFPDTLSGLASLPGIGPYTAAAIGSISFGIPAAAVDGNVLRVYMRKNADQADISKEAVRARVRKELDSEIPTECPGLFNQAMMELGATVCLPNGVPLCSSCPIAFCCKAHAEGHECDYPVKASKIKRKIEEKTVFVFHMPNGYLGFRRKSTGLLAGLYQFPEQQGFLSDDESVRFLTEHHLIPSGEIRFYQRKHIFTHIEWHIRVCSAELSEASSVPDDWMILDENIHPLPTAYRICL